MSRKKIYTREQYYDQFCRLMNRLNYIPEEGEVIVQANKNYPQYWFISNKGRVFTVSTSFPLNVSKSPRTGYSQSLHSLHKDSL